MFEATKRAVNDCLTSANGDYDPARIVGYGVVVIGAVEFLALTAYQVFRTHTFDAGQFAIGLTGISATLAAAAAGVWIKNTTEIQPTQPPTEPPVTKKE